MEKIKKPKKTKKNFFLVFWNFFDFSKFLIIFRSHQDRSERHQFLQLHTIITTTSISDWPSGPSLLSCILNAVENWILVPKNMCLVVSWIVHMFILTAAALRNWSSVSFYHFFFSFQDPWNFRKTWYTCITIMILAVIGKEVFIAVFKKIGGHILFHIFFALVSSLFFEKLILYSENFFLFSIRISPQFFLIFQIQIHHLKTAGKKTS